MMATPIQIAVARVDLWLCAAGPRVLALLAALAMGAIVRKWR